MEDGARPQGPCRSRGPPPARARARLPPPRAARPHGARGAPAPGARGRRRGGRRRGAERAGAPGRTRRRALRAALHRGPPAARRLGQRADRAPAARSWGSRRRSSTPRSRRRRRAERARARGRRAARPRSRAPPADERERDRALRPAGAPRLRRSTWPTTRCGRSSGPDAATGAATRRAAVCPRPRGITTMPLREEPAAQRAEIPANQAVLKPRDDTRLIKFQERPARRRTGRDRFHPIFSEPGQVRPRRAAWPSRR